MHLQTKLLALSTLIAALAAPVATAQGFFPEAATASKSSSGGGSSSGGANYRTFAFTIPVITFTGEQVARLEFNLGGLASLALEANFKPKNDEVHPDDALETGESLVSKGRGFALLFSRYTDEAAMAGFYYAIGAGYREMNADWKVRPATDDKEVDMTLVQTDERLYHRAEMKGVTGHIRGGYRYVGTSIPLSVGLYMGLRHYQVGVRDEKRDNLSEGDEAAYSDMTDSERERLRRRFTTKLEPGIEVGIAF